MLLGHPDYPGLDDLNFEGTDAFLVSGTMCSRAKVLVHGGKNSFDGQFLWQEDDHDGGGGASAEHAVLYDRQEFYRYVRPKHDQVDCSARDVLNDSFLVTLVAIVLFEITAIHFFKAIQRQIGQRVTTWKSGADCPVFIQRLKARRFGNRQETMTPSSV